MNSKNISQKAIEYIEFRKSEEIDLDTISKEMNYSKFHFHRLFLSEMGISVIEYIRRRRIASSTNALKMTEMSITEIAMEYGFNSVDTFIRNFKNYYGITPKNYRTLMLNIKEQKLERCEYRMKEAYKSIKNCTEKEKIEAISILDRILELSKIAHQKGLLSLEQELRIDDSVFLKKSIELLLKGTEYNELEKLLYNYIVVSDLNNHELLIRVLILEGVLLLHKGKYPWDIRNELSSYFGEDFIDIIDDKYDYSEELNTFISSRVSKLDDNRLAKEIVKMNKRSLQRVFRECDIMITSISLMSMDKSVKETVINSLPRGEIRVLSEVVNTLSDISSKHILEAHNEIMRVIQNLRLSNDI